MTYYTLHDVSRVQDMVVDYTCSCAVGWEGRNCDKERDECEQFKPCKNGANCTVSSSWSIYITLRFNDGLDSFCSVCRTSLTGTSATVHQIFMVLTVTWKWTNAYSIRVAMETAPKHLMATPVTVLKNTQ